MTATLPVPNLQERLQKLLSPVVPSITAAARVTHNFLPLTAKAEGNSRKKQGRKWTVD
ncbi:hypothetical protein MPNT_140042 [Candidatus Methylacidithermus pantelleriae]|uniref:Uncharacterized protein n=1 Tax=Candidatus Methylacidithermus pantelleriae TaxID=2744239 RepID=A0A8J2BND9_9BACT|nr:hypothetical protein MPNT_140042 [Candidatus Methylacidithermus pantelleriae]